MEADFYTVLSTYPPLTALVPASKIYPSHYAQGATGTLIRYMKIAGSPGLHMQGSDGLDASLMQIDVRGTTFGAVIKVRDVLMTLLHPYKAIVGKTDFRLIALRSDRGVDFEESDASVEYYTTSLDFDVWSRLAPAVP